MYYLLYGREGRRRLGRDWRDGEMERWRDGKMVVRFRSQLN